MGTETCHVEDRFVWHPFMPLIMPLIGIRYEHGTCHTGLFGYACWAGTYGGGVAGAKTFGERFRDSPYRNRTPFMVPLRRQSDVRPSVLPNVCFFPGDC